MKNLLITSLLFAFVPVLFGCSGTHSEPNVELIQDMMDSPAIKAQEYDADSPDRRGMRVPAEGAVPVGFTPYKYGFDLEAAAKGLKNPIAGDLSQDVLTTGQKYYETHCSICHGSRGEGGAGQTVSQFMALKPPTLLSDKVKNWSDAHIYHVTTVGQGVMGPYASHIPQKYRWQVVNYIRFLQKQDGK